jgi:hypothetical protein
MIVALVVTFNVELIDHQSGFRDPESALCSGWSALIHVKSDLQMLVVVMRTSIIRGADNFASGTSLFFTSWQTVKIYHMDLLLLDVRQGEMLPAIKHRV